MKKGLRLATRVLFCQSLFKRGPDEEGIETGLGRGLQMRDSSNADLMKKGLRRQLDAELLPDQVQTRT